MTTGSDCPLTLEDLLAYRFDDLGDEETARIEEHVFECARCARRLDSLERVGAAVSAGGAAAALGGNVDRSFLERATRDGLSQRDYRIPAGATVTCKAGPEDLVVVRLGADFAGLRDLRLDGSFLDLERRQESALPTREVVADRRLGEVVLVFPGELVRSYPRSRWTLRLRGESSSGPRELGPFVMDHHPRPR